jgi:hypothetical protein
MTQLMGVMDNRPYMQNQMAGGMNQQMSIFSTETNQQSNQNSLFSKSGDLFNNYGQEYQFQMKPTGFHAAASLGATNATQQEKNLLLDMLNSSFMNAPLLQDQVGIDISPQCPLPVEDSAYLSEDPDEKARMKADIQEQRYFPTSAMHNRQGNFIKMDLDCLFFAFYY